MTQSKPLDIMVDIETTAIHPTQGQIWQLGAVDALGRMLSTTVNPSGMLSDPATIKWQEEQNTANWNDAHTINPVYTEKNMLVGLLNWLNSNPEYEGATFWSKGSFDREWLEYRLGHYGLPAPWKYWQCNDLRTLCNFIGAPVPKFPGAHTAIHDARHQMAHLQSLRLRYGT